MQNISEIYKSGDLINQTESYYNNPYLAEKDGDVFLNHQIKVHFGNAKHIKDRMKYWKKPGLFFYSGDLILLLNNCALDRLLNFLTLASLSVN